MGARLDARIDYKDKQYITSIQKLEELIEQ